MTQKNDKNLMIFGCTAEETQYMKIVKNHWKNNGFLMIFQVLRVQHINEKMTKIGSEKQWKITTILDVF